MNCPKCGVSLGRAREDSYRVWACHNPDCPVVMLIVDTRHPNSLWDDSKLKPKEAAVAHD